MDKDNPRHGECRTDKWYTGDFKEHLPITDIELIKSARLDIWSRGRDPDLYEYIFTGKDKLIWIAKEHLNRAGYYKRKSKTNERPKK